MAVPRCAWGRSCRTPFPTPHSEEQPPRLATPAGGPLRHLGGVDGFDEDEAESKGHHGSVVLGRLLAAQRHPLEALELTPKLLDAGTSPIERLRKECRPSLGR